MHTPGTIITHTVYTWPHVVIEQHPDGVITIQHPSRTGTLKRVLASHCTEVN